MTDNNENSTLSDKQKLEINSYVGNLVKSWLTWLGIANFAVLLTALIYIFFILPGKAVSEIKTQVDTDIKSMNQELNKEMRKALLDYERVRGKLDKIKSETEIIISDIKSIKDDLSIIEKGDINQAAKLIQLLDGSTEVKNILEKYNSLSERLKTVEKNSLGITNWIQPSLINNWVDYGGDAGGEYNPTGYFKDNSEIVHLRGLVKNGTDVIFILPKGFRPKYREIHTTTSWPTVFARIDILPDGSVKMHHKKGHSKFISLDGISFKATKDKRATVLY